MTSTIDHMRQLCGEAATTRPKPGDRVRVTGLDGVFRVLSRDAGTYRLVSVHGVELTTGIHSVLPVERAA